jgi:hypothetical protein
MRPTDASVASRPPRSKCPATYLSIGKLPTRKHTVKTKVRSEFYAHICFLPAHRYRQAPKTAKHEYLWGLK